MNDGATEISKPHMRYRIRETADWLTVGGGKASVAEQMKKREKK